MAREDGMDQQQDSRAAFRGEIGILARRRVKARRSFAEKPPTGTSLRIFHKLQEL